MKYLFYLNSHLSSQSIETPEGYTSYFWKPKWRSLAPRRMHIYPFGVWWLFHYLRIFENGDYRLFLIVHDGIVVHRSVVFPPFFRFPFMSQQDLQIGDTWTDPNHRGRGLATLALFSIMSEYSLEKRRIWYIVESENQPSIRVVEKAGFERVGEGIRLSRMGIPLLGYYTIQEYTQQ